MWLHVLVLRIRCPQGFSAFVRENKAEPILVCANIDLAPLKRGHCETCSKNCSVPTTNLLAVINRSLHHLTGRLPPPNKKIKHDQASRWFHLKRPL